nr:unnamed protein product [Callosobruchus chinensis]
MGQERLSDISLLSIEAETLEKLKSSSAINDLINQFAEKKARRVNNYLKFDFICKMGKLCEK